MAAIKRVTGGRHAARLPPRPLQFVNLTVPRNVLTSVNIEIVKRSDQPQRFVVLPKRWIVERTFAWLGRCRRLAKDWECLNRKALAFLKLASIRLMLRKLCNPS
ncbi:transposase [Bradyrhizobium sp. USDA 10063]